MQTEARLLREKVDPLIQRLFGARSEKLDREQLLPDATFRNYNDRKNVATQSTALFPAATDRQCKDNGTMRVAYKLTA